MTPEQMAALTPAEMESTCICGHSKDDHVLSVFGTACKDCDDCDRYRSVWNAGEAQYEQRYSRP